MPANLAHRFTIIPATDDDEYDVFVYYPHPDRPVTHFVTVTPQLAKQHVSRLLARAAVKIPIKDIQTQVTLYRPSGLLIEPIPTLLERTRQWLREHLEDQSVQLDISEVISEVFPEDRNYRELDVIVVTPDIEESLDEVAGDRFGKVIRDRESAIRGNAIDSTTIKTSGTMQELFNADFHAGRPSDKFGPPAALFSPVLGLLHYHLAHLDDDLPEIRIDHHELQRAHAFISASLESYDNEDARGEAVKALKASLHPNVQWKPTRNGITPDVVFGSPASLPCGILQLKNEVGLDGDASLQARVSYVKCVTEDKEEIKRLRKISNCPAVVIGLMGDLVEIGVTVYTDGPYSNYIFSSGRMRLDYHKDANVLRITRAFSAVKLALAGLQKYYEQLKNDPPPKLSIQHLFPSPVPEPSWQGKMPRITFTDRLSRTGRPFILLDPSVVTSEVLADDRRSGLYIGKLYPSGDSGAAEDCVEVVVKFTSQYNAEAHRTVSDAGFAPTLRACVPVCGGLKMIVMDRVQGQNAYAWRAERRGSKLPPTVYESMHSAIEVLHQAGFVFGDLRLSNIMCVPDGRVMLVNFDWAGKAGEARYPVTLNDSLTIWAPGVERYAIMRKEHDLHLLKHIKNSCDSVSPPSSP
ncbi:hypothetical protein C8Q74DRAFT_1363684 [Fomes fomentarius]|nr:hypothetical protein C8Q74DRAFT_1363684 [Fomes fomentarius]